MFLCLLACCYSEWMSNFIFEPIPNYYFFLFISNGSDNCSFLFTYFDFIECEMTQRLVNPYILTIFI